MKKTVISLQNATKREYRPASLERQKYVCVKGLLKYFDITGNTPIDIVLSEMETPDSYRIEDSGFCNEIYVVKSEDEKDLVLLGTWAKETVEKFGLPCYISVEY